ncbi:Detected protein of unknown function [Hibiscus syriacus]|uniref:Uncharacterized protein n=1 Tax=Hibiscus syriacus TaxID=106335 RepID=A0A6A3BIC7_HIBSY|nr:Detected protein of unknown function [Hibiscus syriacus]
METKVVKRRIEDAREKLVSFKNEFVLNKIGPENPSAREDESLVENMKEKFEVGPGESLSVAGTEDTIDELANKVLDLETALRKMEEKLHWIQDLNRSVEDRNNDLQAHLTEAHCNIDCFSREMHNVKLDEVESSEDKVNDCDRMMKNVNAGRDVSHETSKPLGKSEDQKTAQASPTTLHTLSKCEPKEHERESEDEPDWKQLCMKGMENREENLLTEYITMLRSYKDTKKKLMEVETNNQNSLSDIMLQLKELKNSSTMKDEEILSLRRELNLSQTGLSQNNNTDQYAEPRVSTEKSMVIENSLVLPTKEEAKDNIGMVLGDQSQTLSEIEEKFLMNIDELLDENLGFWFRFSTAVQQVPKLENGVKDLQAEVSKLDEQKRKMEVALRDDKGIESKCCRWGVQVHSYQAAKFQGEILNMKQQNNKVAEEIQFGLDIARTLQLEVERTLEKLTEDWEISGSKVDPSDQLRHLDTWYRVPLRSLIFGIKPRKQKTSIIANR